MDYSLVVFLLVKLIRCFIFGRFVLKSTFRATFRLLAVGSRRE